NGALVWAKNITGANFYSNFKPQEMVADKNGNIYLAGGFMHNPDVDPDTGVAYLHYSGTPSLGAYDIFLVSYTPDGRYRWNVTAGSPTRQDIAMGLDVDGEGNSYICGEY